ncbi:ribosome small subunit-dependent GTPase A [Candidatus Methylocalor cossyra]|uniref:Small ribosomal subunit biogenesis GTPase RsgA n=1 Tax=Candidatus Methylocalor cossyra TaxID=3108543 RepID=A0ABM9NEY5_9GAMM
MAGKRGTPEKAPRAVSNSTPPLQPGLVISHLGQGLAVEDPSGNIVLCHTRRRLDDVAVGDRVLWQPAEGGRGRVEQILPRRTLLVRPGHGVKVRPVAANLDRVLVVIAPEPEPDWLLLDQYLIACDHRGLKVALILNKVDRIAGDDPRLAPLADYQALGVPCFRTSARTGQGLPELRQGLLGQCSMLAGQSGVGKSSLTNALLPDKALRVQELSEKAGTGRHTTTTTTLYHLPEGGDLIDSPGVAVFGLAEMTLRDLAAGYWEFRPWIGHCRFNDCRHLSEPDCAVRQAVAEGRISAARYQRFVKLVDKLRHGDLA